MYPAAAAVRPQRAHTLRTPKHEGHCGTPRPAESPKHKNRQCVLVHSWPLSCRTDGSQRDHPMRRRCLIWPIVRCPSQVRPHAVSVAYSTPATQRSSTQRRPLSLARQFRSLLHASSTPATQRSSMSFLPALASPQPEPLHGPANRHAVVLSHLHCVVSISS